MLDRERIIEAVAAVGTVLVMLGAMVWIGLNYGNETALGDEGAPLMVGAIVGFIVLVAIVGAILAFVLSEGAEPDDDGSENAA